MDKKNKELRELLRMQDELATEIETLKDEIKAAMTEQGTDELHGSDWKVTWKPVITNRIDSAALKKALPDIYNNYIRQTSTRRFVVA